MARRKARRVTGADYEIRLPDGQTLAIEVKDVSSEIAIRDVMNQLIMYVHGARAGAVGAASVFGWYVRSTAPWSGASADVDALHGDWQVVGDDLWRAAGEITRMKHEVAEDQPHLFDPAEFVTRGR